MERTCLKVDFGWHIDYVLSLSHHIREHIEPFQIYTQSNHQQMTITHKRGQKTTPKLKQSIQLRNHGIYNKFFDSTTTFQLFENFRSAVEKKHLAIQTIKTKVQKKNHEISAIFCRYLLLFSIFLNGIFNSIVIRIVLKRCLKYVGREKKLLPNEITILSLLPASQKKSYGKGKSQKNRRNNTENLMKMTNHT